MRRFLLVAATVSLSLVSPSLWAQATTPRPAANPTAAPAASPALGTQVALIDIGHILKNHSRYKAARENLMQRGKALQVTATQESKKLNAEAEQLKDFQPGSLEFKKLEASLAQQHSDTRVKLELSRRELVDEEVKLYYTTYQEVEAAVETIAVKYNIQLVLRFDREKMDPADADSIRRGLMNNVVYQSKLDITDMVLQSLNPGVAREKTAPRF